MYYCELEIYIYHEGDRSRSSLDRSQSLFYSKFRLEQGLNFGAFILYGEAIGILNVCVATKSQQRQNHHYHQDRYETDARLQEIHIIECGRLPRGRLGGSLLSNNRDKI